MAKIVRTVSFYTDMDIVHAAEVIKETETALYVRNISSESGYGYTYDPKAFKSVYKVAKDDCYDLQFSEMALSQIRKWRKKSIKEAKKMKNISK